MQHNEIRAPHLTASRALPEDWHSHLQPIGILKPLSKCAAITLWIQASRPIVAVIEI